MGWFTHGKSRGRMLPSAMAKHRHSEDEPPTPVPADTNEPALSIRRHAIVAAAVAGLTLASVTAWALTRPGDDSGIGSPRGTALGGFSSPGAVEGFGQAGTATPSGTGRPTPRPSGTLLPGTPPPTEATPDQTATPSVGGLQATYSMLTWDGGYQVTFVLINPNDVPVLWKVRIQLPSNAVFGDSWSAELARDGSVLTFTPPRWSNGNPKPLAPGAMASFGFLASQPSGDYRMLSCTVDGVECRPAP
jgi:hypothetical protein